MISRFFSRIRSGVFGRSVLVSLCALFLFGFLPLVANANCLYLCQTGSGTSATVTPPPSAVVPCSSDDVCTRECQGSGPNSCGVQVPGSHCLTGVIERTAERYNPRCDSPTTETPSAGTPSAGTPSSPTANQPAAGAAPAAGTRYCNFRCHVPAGTRPPPNASIPCTDATPCSTACHALAPNPNSCAVQIPGSSCADTPAPSCAASHFCSYSCTVTESITQPQTISLACTSDAECDTACNADASNPNSCAHAIPGSTCASYPHVPQAQAFVPVCGAATPTAAPGTTAPTTEIAGTSAELTNPLGETDLAKIIGRVISGVVGVIGAIALLMFVIAGIMWITAGGNDEQLKKAQEMIKNSVIGLVLIFFSYTIISAFMSMLPNGSVGGGGAGGGGSVACYDAINTNWSGTANQTTLQARVSSLGGNTSDFACRAYAAGESDSSNKCLGHRPSGSTAASPCPSGQHCCLPAAR